MTPNRSPGVPDFDPVPLRARRDGWTPARQRAFIAALWSCRCVLEACRRVGMSSASAYKLSRRPDAASFRGAWRAAGAGSPGHPSTSGAPSTSAATAAPRAPFTAVTLWPMLERAAPPVSAVPLTSSTSSTSAATNGMCQMCQLHQLPPDHQLPAFAKASVGKPAAAPPRERPAYSPEAFARAARAAVAVRKARAR